MRQKQTNNKTLKENLKIRKRSRAISNLKRFEQLIKEVGSPKPSLTRRSLPSKFPRIH